MADLMPVYQSQKSPNTRDLFFLIFWFSAMFYRDQPTIDIQETFAS